MLPGGVEPPHQASETRARIPRRERIPGRSRTFRPGFEDQAPHPAAGTWRPRAESNRRHRASHARRRIRRRGHLCWSPESNRSRSRTGRVLDLRAAPAWWTERESNPRRAACKAALRPSAQPEMVESAGIEPTFPRCERGVLPLDDNPVGPSGIEPEPAAYKAAALTIEPRARGAHGRDRTCVSGMSGRRSTVELRAHLVDRRGLEPRFPRCHRGVLPLDDQPVQCLSVESNHDLLGFNQALVPHELPRHGASDGNRTRPLCLDRAAFPPGNLGGIGVIVRCRSGTCWFTASRAVPLHHDHHGPPPGNRTPICR